MTATLAFLVTGGVCLVIAGYLIYQQLPREHRPPPAWMRTENGSSTAAMGSFILLVAGIALLLKAGGF